MLKSLFISLLFASALHAALPHYFSLKTTKNPPQVLLEYPEDHPFGKVTMENRDTFTYFHYTDSEGKLVALARAEKSTHHDVITVYDDNSSLLGIIERSGRIASQSSYSLFDSSSQLVANGQVNFLGTRLHFTPHDDDDKELVLYYRPYFLLLGDYWYTRVLVQEKIDERLIVMVGAIHSTLLMGGTILGE